MLIFLFYYFWTNRVLRHVQPKTKFLELTIPHDIEEIVLYSICFYLQLSYS